MLKDFTQKLVATIKPNYSSQDLIFTEKLLAELVNSELFACAHLANVEAVEWGDVAVSVNKIAKKISSQIEKRML
jgi:hypothetical protein